jgi:hypothetical protein
VDWQWLYEELQLDNNVLEGRGEREGAQLIGALSVDGGLPLSRSIGAVEGWLADGGEATAAGDRFQPN